jgi:hypothetical protein
MVTGSTDTDVILTVPAGVTVTVPVLLELLYVAVTLTGVASETAVVAAVNGAVLLPAATVTDAGTVTDELSLARETVIPPDGAAALSVTTPLAGAPPGMDDG